MNGKNKCGDQSINNLLLLSLKNSLSTRETSQDNINEADERQEFIKQAPG